MSAIYSNKQSKVSVAVNPLESTTIVLPVEPTKEELKEAIVFFAEKYGQNFEEFNSVIDCESSYNYKIDNGKSKGLTQFILSTWLEECSDVDDRDNPIKSLDCMGKLWKKEQKYRWDCWCMIHRENEICKKRGF